MNTVKIALFGATGSGKTVFLSSYYGNQQTHEFYKRYHYRLSPKSPELGLYLLQKFYNLQNGSFPGSSLVFQEFDFNFMCEGIKEPAFNVQLFDYPGTYWTSEMLTEANENDRDQRIAELLNCQLGILVLDGSKYIEGGIPYVRSIISQFTNMILNLNIDNREELPRKWIVMISKADLFDDRESAESIGKRIVTEAYDVIVGFQDCIKSCHFGNTFLLVSSILAPNQTIINANKFMGLNLIVPIALRHMLQEVYDKETERLVKESKPTIQQFVSSMLSDFIKSPEKLAAPYHFVLGILNKFGLDAWIDMTEAEYKVKREYYLQQKDSLGAIMTSFQEELNNPDNQRLFYECQALLAEDV